MILHGLITVKYIIKLFIPIYCITALAVGSAISGLIITGAIYFLAQSKREVIVNDGLYQRVTAILSS